MASIEMAIPSSTEMIFSVSGAPTMGKTIVAIPHTKVVVVDITVVDIMVAEDTIRWPIDEEGCVKEDSTYGTKTATSDETHSSYLNGSAIAGR